jgi:flagellar basal-body rod protein FlgB
MEILPSDRTTSLLQTYLDVQSRRAEIVAGNIANADTPGFTAKELDFDDYLQDAVAQANLPPFANTERNSSTSNLRVIEQTPTVLGLDGNTVDVGREMSTMAQIGSSFNFGVKMLQSRLRLLRTAIREGR